MRKGLTEIVFILDRSGSMAGLEADTIGGYNSMLERQKKEDGEAIISTVLFDDRTEVLHDRKNLADVSPITEKDYYVRGCTALLDAVGGAIHHIGLVHKYAREEDVPEKTLFIITTDGMENASRNYTYDEVKRMIEHEKEKYHWEFLFLGANIDAVQVAGRFGVSASRAVRFENDSEGQRLNYQVMSEYVSMARMSKSAAAMNECFESAEGLKEIEEDYRELQTFARMPASAPSVPDGSGEDFSRIMPRLNRKEQELISYLYGLNGKQKHSYAETARYTGMSEPRVRQMESRLRRQAEASR